MTTPAETRAVCPLGSQSGRAGPPGRVPVLPPAGHHRAPFGPGDGREHRVDDVPLDDGADAGADVDVDPRDSPLLGLDQLVVGGAATEAGWERALDELEQLGVEDADAAGA